MYRHRDSVRHSFHVSLTEKMVSVYNLPHQMGHFHWHNVKKFDGDGHEHGDGDGTCKQALSLTSGLHGVLQYKPNVRSRTIRVEFDPQNLRLEI